ncbi:universal stress protein [Saccharibacillus endophyticus]|uniref:Universal stress protein YxiE n=1 Tax=Saccharibacillus endophyticus TaxID=2060666 RepID=A0ABQ1ZW42_9BACL|nr:universal stress protein [Saccharibacillus endophyticus]GGH78929.1 universal stress protein YxiE [Saccharibacillus endophyticus]
MKHIVAAIDGSAGSVRALEEAIKLGMSLAESPKVTALHIDSFVSMNEPPFGVDPDERIEAEGLALLQSAGEKLAASGLAYGTAVRKGDAARGICEFARSESADLIVIGTRGHGLAAELLLGSVSHKVIQHAPCPVMTIR